MDQRSSPAMGMIRIMEIPEALFDDLRQIDLWATNALPLPPLATNDDYMTLAIEIMNNAQFLLRVDISLTPTELQSEKGVTKRSAIVLGHLVRIHKLYNALRYHTTEKQRDMCMILTRLLVETASKAEYLMKARRRSFRSFVLASYRPEKQMLDDLLKKSAARPLLPIERRMIASIKHNLREDRISVKELMANGRWDVDGKNFKQILSDLGHEAGYAYGFGNGSHWVHGDWFDLKSHHLEKVDGRYCPRWQSGVPDPRGVCPATILCLTCLIEFIKWNRSDPNRLVVSIIQKLLDVTHRLDAAHELSLQE
jgi:hypothetical protein